MLFVEWAFGAVLLSCSPQEHHFSRAPCKASSTQLLGLYNQSFVVTTYMIVPMSLKALIELMNTAAQKAAKDWNQTPAGLARLQPACSLVCCVFAFLALLCGFNSLATSAWLALQLQASCLAGRLALHLQSVVRKWRRHLRGSTCLNRTVSSPGKKNPGKCLSLSTEPHQIHSTEPHPMDWYCMHMKMCPG
jgi:hypothetical protein